VSPSPEGLELLFLGSGNGFAPGGRFYSSFLLNGRYLFDASPAALPQLRRAGAPPEAIDAVFISHFHGDHFLGLPFLLLDYAHVSRRTAPLTIVGPPGIEERLAAVSDATFPNLLHKERRYTIQYVEAADGGSGRVGDLSFVARRVQHAESLDCFGYRVGIAGRALAYSGDTALCDALVALGEGTDVFVLECSCWESPCAPYHMAPDDIRELRKRLGPKPAFVLTHLDAGDRDIGVENTLLASDLARITL